MAVFRVERNRGYTVMSNHHLRNRDLTLKAKVRTPLCKISSTGEIEQRFRLN